jgi:DNA-binding MarR family transcriptional regulator
MIETIDTSYLESLIGYNTRRAALSMIGGFTQKMEVFDLRPVEFSVLSLIGHNPGATAVQLCHELNIKPSNIVLFIKELEEKSLILRKVHPTDKRVIRLTLSSKGRELMKKAEKVVVDSEMTVASKLTQKEIKVMLGLLKKIYK